VSRRSLHIAWIGFAPAEEVGGVPGIATDLLHGLASLGHRRIAFMKGNPLSSDSTDRWKAICEVAQRTGLAIDPELVVQIDIDDPTPQLGYPFAKRLLARRKPFTALFAYNDISAIGSIRAFQEAGLRVPEDISVVGFDDIQIAVHTIPSLTTVRQPLQKMGELAARALLNRIEGVGEFVQEIAVEPDFVVRCSTGKAPAFLLASRI